jgi:16S rRNA processing protein RimM
VSGRPRDYEELTWIGSITGPHGLKGELKVAPQTDDPEYYESLEAVFLEVEDRLRREWVESFAWRGSHWLLALKGVADRTAAETLKRARVLIPDEQLKPLEPGEFFLHQLIGCTVLDLNETRLGTLTGVLETGANNVYEVQTESGELLVPAVPHIVKQVDVAQRRVVIDPIPGMLDEDA